MRELILALAVAGAMSCPLTAYIAASGGMGQPIYSGWKLLFLLGASAFALVGLVGAVVFRYERRWGSALLGSTVVAVVTFVFLLVIRDRPAQIALLAAGAAALPFIGALALTFFEYWQAARNGTPLAR